ncbi:MAG: DUF2142 domain-containing protein [Eubacteriales bacterium]|nr:DUF2142 domain-containing protein [Eubacteriales bacterium]
MAWKKETGRILAAVLLAGIFFALWWITRMADYPVYSETYVPVGAHTFTAEGKELSAIGVRSEDSDYKEFLFRNQVGLTIGLYDSDGGSLWEEELGGNYLKTDGFTLYDSDYAKQLPIELTKGESYSIYLGSQDGTRRAIDLKHLSLMVYGETRSMLWFYFILLLIGGGAVALAWWILQGEQKRYRFFTLLFFLQALLFIAVMPVRTMDAEGGGFLSAYHLSNEMMGRGEYDADGRVRIEENALRNLEATDNGQALYRFWTEANYGNERTDVSEESATSPHTADADGALSAFYLIPALGITLGRILQLPWQGIYLLGRLFNLLVMSGLLAVLFRSAHKRSKETYQWGMLLCLFPSVIVGSTSYTVVAPVIETVVVLGILAMWIKGKREGGNFVKEKIFGKISTVLSVLGGILLLFSLLYGKTDELVRNVIGTEYYQNEELIHSAFTYGFLALFVLAVLGLTGKRKIKVAHILTAQVIWIFLMVIDAFSGILRA